MVKKVRGLLEKAAHRGNGDKYRKSKIAIASRPSKKRIKSLATKTKTRAKNSRVVKTARVVHHHVAVRPHNHLMNRWSWYECWHNWKWHSIFNISVLVVSLASMFVFSYSALASPTDTNVWTFNTPEDYSYTNTKIEPDSNNLRLKLQDVVQNFSVAGGQLQSNNVLDVTANDTYYFVATDLGIDVIRQDTWTRTGYVNSGGGFGTIDIANDYLYAGKNGGIYRWQISNLTDNTALGSPRYSTSTTPALGSQNIRKLSATVISSKVYLAVATVSYVELIKDEQGTNTIVKSAAGGGYTINGATVSSDGALYYDMRHGSFSVNSTIFVKYNAITQGADWTYNTNNVDFGSDLTAAHGPNPSNGYTTGVKVTSGTSTANSGDNTIYVETEAGLSVIQENRTTPASGTINNYTTSSRGSNLISGATAQARYGTALTAGQTIDNNTSSFYQAPQLLSDDWFEYDLGINKTFNFLKQYFWTSSVYTPSSYVVESSTQGTSANLASSATVWAPWNNSSFPNSGGSDTNYSTSYNTGFATNVIAQPMYEQSFATNQTISGVDMQFYDQATTGKNYTIQGSTTATTALTASTVTVSSKNPSTSASHSIDRTTNTRWLSNAATNTAPQWLQLDYGSSKTFAGISFVDTTTIADYSIDYSEDGTNWTSAYSTTGNSSGASRIKFTTPVTGQYLRVYVTKSTSPASPSGVAIYEVEAFSSMFESGTVTTLDTVTNNSDIGRMSNFTSTSVKSVRILVTSTFGANANFGVREMKTYQTAFGSGTVTQLSSMSGLSIPVTWTNSISHDVSFNSTTARYVRIRYTGYANTNLLVSEIELNNTSLPNYAPSKIIGSSIDSTNNRYYSVHNSAAVEDGKILRIDGVNVNSPSIGQTINKASFADLASNEFSSVKYVDSTKLLAGTSAGASFIGQRYATDLPTITPNNSFSPVAVSSWKNFTESATKNGGEVYYQISNDDGSTWNYWNGTAWVIAGAGNYNTAADIDTNILSFALGTRSFKWKAFLASNGSQAITLNSVTLVINPDTNPPTTNASNISMNRSNGGASIAESAWTNASTPYISWTAGVDDAGPGATGIKGYCLYVGSDNSASPESDKGLLGASPLDTDGACPYAVSGTSIDLSTANTLTAALQSSNNYYYVKIKALDNSNNVYTSAAESFSFRFDNTAPSAPGFVSGPSQFIATRDVTLTWPATGDGAISDVNSGIVGLQYRIGNGTWYGDSHNGNQNATDLLVNDGSYRTDATYDYPDLIEGNNIIYFRSLDNAGNYSSTYATAVIKINTASPSSPQSVTATPSSNTTNSFGFSWAPPSTFVGNASDLSYCYTVNTLPTVNTCTYTEKGADRLLPGSFATQPGTNTFYVVAKDEAGNINYATYGSAEFTANTSAPGIPLTIEIADISTRATSNWKLAVSWAAPTDTGAGVSSYRILRSLDGVTFGQIATTAGLSFVDTNLTQQDYYYQVKACDSANNCGAASATVTLKPTGKYTEPAELVSAPTVSGITTKRATIAWVTNRESDSKLAIGKKRGQYSPSEISNSSQITSHTVALDNLDAGTTYYYVARWTDEDGNTGVSDEGTFQTAPAPVLKEVNTLKVGLTNSLIQFTTKDANIVDVIFGKSEDFGGIKTTNTSKSESTYEVELSGLDDGVKYFYKVIMYDSEGGKYQSSIFSFSTLPRPRITQLQFQPVTGEPTSTQKVSWKTNVPASSQISYNVDGSAPTEVSDSKLLTDHEMVIRDLVDSSNYSLIALSRDGAGNLATSDRQSFKTALDTRPPKISDISIEKVIRGTGTEARGQIVVTWKTDEPATSQIQFAEGASTTELNNSSTEDGNLTTEHISIVSDLTPSKAYNVRPLSRDKASNKATGTTQTVIIGRATDSVISIIFNTLQRMFGYEPK